MSNAFGVLPNDKVMSGHHCLPQTRCETIPRKATTDDHSVLIEGNKAFDCSVFLQWRDQSQFDFGFIPLSNFMTPRTQAVNNRTFSPFEAHRLIRKSGTSNFMQC